MIMLNSTAREIYDSDTNVNVRMVMPSIAGILTFVSRIA